MKIKLNPNLEDVFSDSKCYWCGKITPYYTCSRECLKKHNALMARGHKDGMQTYANVDEGYRANGLVLYNAEAVNGNESQSD